MALPHDLQIGRRPGQEHDAGNDQQSGREIVLEAIEEGCHRAA
jgi:hypothetical protein